MVHRTTETDWKSLYEAETRISARQAAEIVQLREQSSVITEQSMTWQPIETAPKDGTAIDLHTGNNRWCNYRWDKEFPNGAWSDAMYSYRDWRDRPFMYADQPTHWMPIPAPPTGQP